MINNIKSNIISRSSSQIPCLPSDKSNKENNSFMSRMVKMNQNKTKGALGQIDIDKIGKGRLMTEGSFAGKSFGLNKYTGLKGQLAQVRRIGKRTSTKNLSKKNTEQMYDLLSKSIQHSSVNSDIYISRRDRMNILQQSRKLTRQSDSDFTFQDRKDLVKIVDNMRKQQRDKILQHDSVSNINNTHSITRPLNNFSKPVDLNKK